MKRRIPGLHQAADNREDHLEGSFLVRIERAFYRWHPLKPFFILRFAILEPVKDAGQTISARLYCTPKALWKLRWFLQAFSYDTELFSRDEVDEKAFLGLRGVVRVSHITLNGRSFPNLEGFTPAGEWEEISATAMMRTDSQEMLDDL